MLARVSSRLKFAASSSATSTTKQAQGTFKGSSAKPARSSIVSCRRTRQPANRRAMLLCSMLLPTMLRTRSGCSTMRNTWACDLKSVWTRNRLPLACLLPTLPDLQALPTLIGLPSRVVTARNRSLPMAAAVKLAFLGRSSRSSACVHCFYRIAKSQTTYWHPSGAIAPVSTCFHWLMKPCSTGLIPISTNEKWFSPVSACKPSHRPCMVLLLVVLLTAHPPCACMLEVRWHSRYRHRSGKRFCTPVRGAATVGVPERPSQRLLAIWKTRHP